MARNMPPMMERIKPRMKHARKPLIRISQDMDGKKLSLLWSNEINHGTNQKPDGKSEKKKKDLVELIIIASNLRILVNYYYWR